MTRRLAPSCRNFCAGAAACLVAVAPRDGAEALDAPLAPPPAVPDDLDDAETVDEAFATLDDQRRRLTRGHGAALAERLVGLCEASLTGDARNADAAVRPRPMLLATIDAEALLDRDRTPGWLLHTLAGGRMMLMPPIGTMLASFFDLFGSPGLS